jgi:hypothetical protein
MSATARHQDFITAARIATRKVWEGINELRSMQKEWNGKDYGTTLPAGTGMNDGVTKAEVGAVVFDTVDAVDTLLAAGHATNLSKLL